MRLTPDQKRATRCEENVSLTACPGSGKTRVIVSKLAQVLNEVRDSPRAVACITYTNSAVWEIEGRLLRHVQPGDDAYYDICTIHSFCLAHIFRPFCYLINGYKSGFRVLVPDSDEFKEHVAAVCARFGRHQLGYSDLEEFTQLRVGLDGTPAGDVLLRGALTPEVARAFWTRIRKAGLVDFANIIYYSFELLRRRPEVLSYVASKFAWILVDEFQDTTDLQVEILTLIAGRRRTRFLLVGDPFQSIYRFAGARPELAGEFASRIGARTDITLSGNFRSSRPIVVQANRLFPRAPAMSAVGESAGFTEVPVHRVGASPFEVVTDHYLPALDSLGIPIGDAAILAPTWYSLFPLSRRLREYGISVVGPGARPYRRTRTFALLAEQVCGHLSEPRPESITGIERTLFNTLLDVTGRAYFDLFSYEGRVLVFRLLERAKLLNDANESAIAWLEAAAGEFSTLLLDEKYLAPSEASVFAMSVEEMKSDMRNSKVDANSLTIADLGIYANPGAALKLVTLHHAKGREYEAVAMIDLHEGRIPHYRAEADEELAEAKRVFYVGVTRARRFLLYVTDQSSWRNQPSRYLRAETGVGVC